MKNTKTMGIMMAIALIAALLAGCAGEKEAVPVERFAEVIKDVGFEAPIDTTAPYSEAYEGVLKAVTASDEHGVTAHFFIFGDDHVETAFRTMKTQAEEQKGASCSAHSSSGKNYDIYTQKSDGIYFYIARVEQTILVLAGPATQAEEIDGIAGGLGY